ncbi:MAG: ParB/RepB/Spo0J family partition protein [Oscillospiraceae bacterium]|nr:ParB/RepB/Spo0J family partition protein [Oscillospiraceae bacterium]
MAGANRGLGKGLGALLGDAAVQTESQGALTLPLSQIEPCAAQPRKYFDDAALDDLAASIREHGIIQPLTVRKLASGYYQIIAGERRWRAARLAGLREVPAVIIEADDRKAMELALIENLQREDLNPIEEAEGYKTLIETYRLTQEQAAESVGKSRSAVANAMRLLALEESVLEDVRTGRISAGHARALLPLSEKQQKEAAQLIFAQNLSVRQTEALVKKLTTEKKDKPLSPEEALRRDYAQLAARELGEKLGRGVNIVSGRKKGRLELEYYGLDDLNELLEALALLKTRKGGEKK